MAESKHTPGEWCTKPLVNAGPTVMTKDWSRLMVDGDGKEWPTMHEVAICRSMADAYLMAAAPEMAEELKRARRDIGIVLAQLDWLMGATGELLDDEDMAIVEQIQMDYSGESAALAKASPKEPVSS